MSMFPRVHSSPGLLKPWPQPPTWRVKGDLVSRLIIWGEQAATIYLIGLIRRLTKSDPPSTTLNLLALSREFGNIIPV